MSNGYGYGGSSSSSSSSSPTPVVQRVIQPIVERVPVPRQVGMGINKFQAPRSNKVFTQENTPRNTPFTTTTPSSFATYVQPAAEYGQSGNLALVAPLGFHYMPDGSLMSDAEHEAIESLPRCAENNANPNVDQPADKRIQSLDFDSSDVSNNGETRNFTINATNGSVFSLEIKSSANKYYNFYTNLFQTAYTNLNKVVTSGVYQFSVVFPIAGPVKYDIFLFAEDDTLHGPKEEVRFADDTVDLNSSTGSDSRILQKVLWQGVDRALTYAVSAKSPNSVAHLSDHATITPVNYLKSATPIVQTSFSFSVTSASTKAFQISKQPTSDDIFVEVERTIGSAPAVIEGEDISSSTHYSWPINNIDGLSEGMSVIGTNVTASSAIGSYQETITSLPNSSCEQNFIVKRVEALDTLGTPPTLTRDISGGSSKGVLITTQTGNVTFDKQQAAALADDDVTFLAYGPEKIKELTGWEIELNDLKVELTKPTTTTTAASTNSTTITVASGDGIVDNVSTVSGIGINAAAGNPTVTAIGSYSGTTATLTVDSAQTLESGTTLTFHDSGETVTISGNIVFKTRGKTYGTNYAMPGWDGKFYFDLEKFITATNETS